MTDMNWIAFAMAALATLASLASTAIAAWVKIAQIKAEGEAKALRDVAERLAREKAAQDVEITTLKTQKVAQDVEITALQSQSAALKAQNADQAGQIAALEHSQTECLEQHRQCEERVNRLERATGLPPGAHPPKPKGRS